MTSGAQLTTPIDTHLFIFLSGFLPLAAIAYKKGTKFNKATVQVQAAANDVYSTAIGVINDDPAIELLKKDDEKLKAEARKGKLLAKIEVKKLDNGNTKLIVKADAGKDKKADKELALRIVKRICDTLGVKYVVNEK
jgi:hypothetical protein